MVALIASAQCGACLSGRSKLMSCSRTGMTLTHMPYLSLWISLVDTQRRFSGRLRYLRVKQEQTVGQTMRSEQVQVDYPEF